MSGSDSTNRKGAVALGYKPEKQDAPHLLAKGVGELAEKIIKIARDNNILVQEDPLLFSSLNKLEVGEEIPTKLYQVIAELLAYVYKIDSKRKRGYI